MINENNTTENSLNEAIKDSKSERRNSKRFDEKLIARFENEQCTVLNVSEKGVLLQADTSLFFFSPAKTVDFELKINDQWILLRGKIMWIQSDVFHSKIGLNIQNAPELYFQFVRELYE